MAREVLIDPEGLATGVSYIDKKTRKEVQVRGKIVVVAASACETARLLLNSRSLFIRAASPILAAWSAST